MATKEIHRYYRESNTAINEQGVLVRPALLLVEGTIKDALGQVTNYTREHIDKIVEATNAYAKFNEIKLFNDHDYSQESRIGAVAGSFSARDITELDIPENGDRSVIGRYAIFNDGLEVRSPDAIAQYHSGLLKELSVGIDLKGKLFEKGKVIFEVSAVAFPAVNGAMLYSKNANTDADDTSKYAFTFESQLRRADKTYSNDDINATNATQKGFGAFEKVIDNIKNANDDELPKSRYKCIKNAVSGLSDCLMGVYAPKPDPEESNAIPVISINSKEIKKMTEEITQYSSADITAMQTEIALLKKQTHDALKFSMLNAHATKLVQAGKLEPAKYSALFDGTESFANYQAGLNGDPLESFLSYVESTAIVPATFAPSIYGKTPLLNQDVPERTGQQSAKVETAKEREDRLMKSQTRTI